MHVREMLIRRRDELKANAAAIEQELNQIARALKAIDDKPTEIGLLPLQKNVPVPPPSPSAIRHRMPVNDAIVLAVEAGNKTPVSILQYLRTDLGITTTLNSVRSRVSPLKQMGKIGHDGTGWIPVPRDPALFGETNGDS